MIAGHPFAHLLYHFVMVYSRWEHVGVVLGGESFTALAENLQQALWSLGGVPHNHRTDSLSAAFRNLTADQREDITLRYEAFVGHYGMEASRNNRGEAHENGAVESQNRHLKTAIAQALILRGNRDFASIADYRRFVDLLVARRNRQRADAVLAERAQLKPLPTRRTVEPEVRLRRNRLHRDRCCRFFVKSGHPDRWLPGQERILQCAVTADWPAFAGACL